MNETIAWIGAFVVGVGLGILFFGGLWFTVRKAVLAKIPALWIFFSFLLRMSVTLLGFYIIGADNWRHLLLCFLGFIASRFMVVHFTKTLDAKQLQLKKEGPHGA